MIKMSMSIAALVFLAGCDSAGGSAEPDSAETAVTEEAAPAAGDTAEAPVEAPAADDAATAGRSIAEGKVDSLVLETDPPIVMMTGADGTQYIATVAPAASDSVVDAFESLGSAMTLDCKPAQAPDGAEPGYTWLEDCKLAG